MYWSTLALSASFIIGLGSVIEKLLVSRYLPGGPATFLGWLGITMIPHAVVLAFFFPIPQGVPMTTTLAMLGAGASWGMAGNLMYRALQKTETSRVWPVLNLAPIYVALMAVFFLGETLTGWQWSSILVAVLGTVLISVQPGRAGEFFKIDRSVFGMLIIASLLLAVGQVIAKYGLEEMPPLSGFWLMRFGMFASMSLNLSPGTIRNMLVSTRSPKAMLLIGLTEMLIFPAAVLMMVFATDLGPVSLVSTINATVPAWVLLFSTLLSIGRWNLLNESLDRRTLTLKGIAVTLMLVGVLGVTLL